MLSQAPEDVVQGPKQGVYFYGAYVEGGRWDGKEGALQESLPKETHVYMPVIWLDPIVRHEAFDAAPGFYNCPFYKVSSRAGASVGFRGCDEAASSAALHTLCAYPMCTPYAT